MPKSANQKLRLLFEREILLRETDEENPITTKQLISRLEDCGVQAERKTIYSDIESLSLYGMDIIKVSGKNGGYYVGERDFELPELKLLVDAVQTSKFITKKKSAELIGKIERLTSKYQAQVLHRQVYVSARIKNMNESIYYNVDKIYQGIDENKQIEFFYMEYNLDKKRVPRRNGKRYKISPYALTWNDDNYYLIGYDGQSDTIKHYRVDKMENIVVLKENREGETNIDIGEYSKKVFSMFGGSEESVTLNFYNRFIGVVIDRFGTDVPVIKTDSEHFETSVTVKISPQFFGWLASLGRGVKIISPISVKDRYKEHIQSILE